ncbi:unannotated protein [freshwater metagenome]|uniref:Unannotated protein n=1 Tax=freshwater metagenome TaxID=449393 RepID=A0A6J6XPM2_9ZZZZ
MSLIDIEHGLAHRECSRPEHIINGVPADDSREDVLVDGRRCFVRSHAILSGNDGLRINHELRGGVFAQHNIGQRSRIAESVLVLLEEFLVAPLSLYRKNNLGLALVVRVRNALKSLCSQSDPCMPNGDLDWPGGIIERSNGAQRGIALACVA